MPQIDRLRDILAHVTYKPGWRISIANGPRRSGWPPNGDEIIVAVQYMVKDPNDTSRAIVRYFRRSFYEEWLSGMPDSDLFRHVIRKVIIEAEMFELDACLKVDGICFQQPQR